jgi:hypothetical protein
MNSKPASMLRNDRGSALIIVLLVLVAVTTIGLLAARTSLIEERIASYDKFHKVTWYATDAVVLGLMPELIEQNIANRGFGSYPPPIPYGNAGNLDVYTSDFYMNDQCAVPSETNRDVEAKNLSGADVNVSVYGTTELSEGNAIQLPEGYHGRGHGLAGGGAAMIFVIRGLGRGSANTEARVAGGWVHVI